MQVHTVAQHVMFHHSHSAGRVVQSKYIRAVNAFTRKSSLVSLQPVSEFDSRARTVAVIII